MNILILANNDEGLYQFRKELLVELLKNHVVYATVPDGPYRSDLEKLGIKLTIIPFDRHGVNPISDIKLLCKYLILIKKVRPSVVLTYTIKPNVYGGIACALTKTPLIANITGLGTAVENGGLMQKITTLLYRAGLCKAKKVFFQNQANREFMRKKLVVSGNDDLLPGSGVNLQYFSQLPYPKSSTIHFSFISRIMKEKGFEQYIEAAVEIHRKYPNTVFHICGMMEQNYESVIDALQRKGVVLYHGNIRDVRIIHKISHCTIHPTYYPEGLSNVLLESLACGRPIITTNRSGCKEVVDDGINGFVVEQKNAQDLVQKIENFLSLSYDQKKRMGEMGRLKVERYFSRTIVVNKYMKEINAIQNG